MSLLLATLLSFSLTDADVTSPVDYANINVGTGAGKGVHIGTGTEPETKAEPTAQPAPTSDETPPAKTTATAPVTGQPAYVYAYEALRNANLKLGFDEETNNYVFVGQATIAGEPNDPQFGEMRYEAFLRAYLDALTKQSECIATELKVSIADELVAPRDEQSNTPARPADATEDLIRAEVEKTLGAETIERLRAQGVQAMRGAVEKVLSTAKLRNAIDVASNEEVSAAQIWKSFEDSGNERPGSVAIVCISSKTSRQMAKAMTSEASVSERAPKIRLDEWLKGFSTEELMFTRGAMLRRDENGAMNLIAFGQSTARANTPLELRVAHKNAELEALQSLRGFMGMAVSSSAAASGERTIESIASEAGDVRTRFASVKAMQAYQSATGASVLLSGAMPIRHWEAVHPASKALGVTRPTCGVVYRWTIGGKTNAGLLGASASDATDASPTEAAAKKATGASGSGAQGDID